MMKTSGWILMSGLILCAAGRSSAQMFPPGGPQQQSPAMAEMQKELADLTKEMSPELYAYQEQLRGLDQKIGAIIKNLQSKSIDKKKAKEQLLPLIKEQKDVQNNPDYLAEQRLMQVYFSSPEYQAKASAIRNKFNAAQHPAGQAGPTMTPAGAPAKH